MPVEIRAVRQAVNIATGNQDFDVSGWGSTPQAALYFVTNATVDNTPVDHGILGIGAAISSTKRHTVGMVNEHNVATSNTWRRAISDECIVILDPSDGSVDGEADFVQFNSGGSRVNWGAAPSAAFLMTALYFAGFDSVDLQKLDRSASSPQTVTVGFQADIVVVFQAGISNGDSATATSECDFGLAVRGSGQGHIAGRSVDGQGNSSLDRGISNTKFFGRAGSGNWNSTITIGNFDSTGFDLTLSTGTADTGDDWFILSLELPAGISAWAGGIASPASTGDDPQIGPGFTPQFLLGIISDLSSFDSWDQGGDAGGWGIVVAMGSEEFSHAVADEDGVGTTNTQSLVDDTLIHLATDDGTDQLIASLSSFDANGWTPNYSTVDGTARQQFWLAIEEDEEEVGGTILPQVMHHYYESYG